MPFSQLTAEQRRALYAYLKERRDNLQRQAYDRLGARCALCGGADDLRIRFLDSNHPLRARYRTNPATLCRRLCAESELRAEVRLLCGICRLKNEVAA